MQNSIFFDFNTYLISLKEKRLFVSVFYILFCLTFSNCSQNSPKQILTAENQVKISDLAININTASAEELEKLPKIGKELAQRIIEHREKYGAFRRAEDLILVRGMSDKKFRELRSLVKTE